MMKSLDKIEKKESFRVPANYFEDITDNVTSAIKSSQPVSARIISIVKPHITLAAAMIALVIVTYTGLRLLLPGESELPLLQTSELAEYLSIEADETLIMDELNSIENSDGDINSANEIIDYLINNGIDYNTIIENY